ncbi:AAA family ATPase [uncultured Shewanella sp.]|uniref:AAA family ATPase n=1 Tax=uncultured Shewanella sp. TaxID=173975 RepID=UPI002628E9F0|nr:AAA family ATPase [uncultured Shewanella sp.]
MDLQKRVTQIISHITEGMFEREDVIAVALLGALSNQNTFLFGPPGTAKSLISRRIACAFDGPTYFECLMNRFSTPEEVFGPVSIKALKEDQYTRKTERYLPRAEFAFLDEIWKSSPAILNSLLTLINEKIFKNGEEIEKVPLKALIAASNETPVENQGLEALYDRFIVRLMVEPIHYKRNFESLVNAQPTEAYINLPDNLIIKQSEWQNWSTSICSVSLSNETMLIIHSIRRAFAGKAEELNIYVSDRRWQKAAQLLKASAFFNGRAETNHSDALLLSHCLWTTEENREAVVDIVHASVNNAGFSSDISLAELDREKEDLDKEIHKELFYRSDVYDAEKIGNKKYFKALVNFSYGESWNKKTVKRTLFIPYSEMKSKNEFKPVNANGNELDGYRCSFDGQGTCAIKGKKFDNRYSAETTFTPKVLFYKGDKKDEVNHRLVSALKVDVVGIREKLMGVLECCEAKMKDYRSELESPFVNDELISIPLNGIQKQISDLKTRIKDCERLEALCCE